MPYPGREFPRDGLANPTTILSLVPPLVALVSKLMRIPAKILIANAHGAIGNEASIVILARDAKGVCCFTNMDNKEALNLICDFGDALGQALVKGKCDA